MGDMEQIWQKEGKKEGRKEGTDQIIIHVLVLTWFKQGKGIPSFTSDQNHGSNIPVEKEDGKDYWKQTDKEYIRKRQEGKSTDQGKGQVYVNSRDCSHDYRDSFQRSNKCRGFSKRESSLS